MDILIAMAKVWVALIIGFFLFKKGILTKESNAAMSKVLANVTCPCLIFNSIVTMGTERRGEAYLLLIIGCGIYVIMAVISFVALKILRMNKEKFGTYFGLLLFGNVGFMGLPLAESLFGDVGLFYMGILNIHFTLFIYTIGKYMISGEEHRKNFSFKALINIGTIGVIVATVCYLIGIRFPAFVMEPISFVGQITSPLAMMMLGGTIATFSLKNVFNNWKNYIVALVRLLVFPAVGFLIMNAIWGANMLTITTTIYMALPASTMVLIWAIAYDGDVEAASSNTALMTVLSIVTIPALWFFIKAVGA